MGSLFRAAVTAALVLSAGDALAKPTSEIGKWYCSVLKSPFDHRVAFKNFPLEKLPKPVEKRKTSDTGRVNVSLTATGEEYEVEYTYAFRVDDVNDIYGLDLSVQASDMTAETEEASLKWLREFGKPKKNMFGWYVGAGPELTRGSDNPVFKFAVWPDSGMMRAEWFHPKHLKHAASLCE